MKRGQEKPGRKRAERRLATAFPNKRSKRVQLLRAGYDQKRLTKQQWDAWQRASR